MTFSIVTGQKKSSKDLFRASQWGPLLCSIKLNKHTSLLCSTW